MPLRAALPLLQLGYSTGWPLLPHAVEGSRLIAIDNRVDHSATVDELGIHGRSFEESLTDTVRWLADAGHIPPAAAGHLLKPEEGR